MKLYEDLTFKDRIFDLSKEEQWWADRYETFLRKGYQLRRRYSPGWKPSWIGTNINPFACEDAYRTIVSTVKKTDAQDYTYDIKNTRILDARKLDDNSVVVIKRVSSSSEESNIGTMLSTPERQSDSANHCAPILDVFPDETDNDIAFIVMPLYRKFNDPPFYYVEEVVDFFTQSLEVCEAYSRSNIVFSNQPRGLCISITSE